MTGIMHKLVILLFSVFYITLGTNFPNLDDSIIFSINWAGFNGKTELLDSPDYEELTLVSVDEEKFQCLFPLNYGIIEDESSSYKGPGPLALLLPTLRKKSCSNRFESYWSYDVCHGDRILQYHRETEGISSKPILQQQYVLGRITAEEMQRLEIAAAAEAPVLSTDITETKVEGSNTPYYAVLYADGTECEVTGAPRRTRVLYVCYPHGRFDVYAVKETATCQYEVIVLTDELCNHPLYKKREVLQSQVHCMATVPGLRRPRELLRVETHSLKMKMMPQAELSSKSEDGAVALGKVDGDYADMRVQLVDDEEGLEEDEDTDDGFSNFVNDDEEAAARRSKKFPPQPLTKDRTAVKRFLAGEDCLDGGVGWWRYEFCYGRHVTQFHTNHDGSKATILLGSFDKAEHIEWIVKHPNKAPSNYQVTHMYTGGSVCDVTGKPRTVEVRLKCFPPSTGYGITSVSLWLMEPEPCRYVLGVETGLVCDLLAGADEHGLFKTSLYEDTKTVKDSSKSPAGESEDNDRGSAVSTEGDLSAVSSRSSGDSDSSASANPEDADVTPVQSDAAERRSDDAARDDSSTVDSSSSSSSDGERKESIRTELRPDDEL